MVRGAKIVGTLAAIADFIVQVAYRVEDVEGGFEFHQHKALGFAIFDDGTSEPIIWNDDFNEVIVVSLLGDESAGGASNFVRWELFVGHCELHEFKSTERIAR